MVWDWLVLQLVAAILCIICLRSATAFILGLQIDLIGFWNTIVFSWRKLLQPGENYIWISGFKKNYFRKYGFIRIENDDCISISFFTIFAYSVYTCCSNYSVLIRNRKWNGIFLTLESIPDILLILLSQLLLS